MKTFDLMDFGDTLPNYGYLLVQLSKDTEYDIEKTTSFVYEYFAHFRDAAKREMKPQFFDVMLLDEKKEVQAKFTISINPHNSTSVEFHLLRVQFESKGVGLIDTFRNLPVDQLMAMVSHALGLLAGSQE